MPLTSCMYFIKIVVKGVHTRYIIFICLFFTKQSNELFNI